MRWYQAQLVAGDASIDIVDDLGRKRGRIIVQNIGVSSGPDPWRTTPLSADEQARGTSEWTLERLHAVIVLYPADPVR